MRDGGRDARVREDSSPLKDTGLCCGARQDQSCVPSSDSPCCATRTRAKVSLHVQSVPVPRSCTISILSSLLPSGCQGWPASQDQQDTPCWRSPLL